MTAPERKSPRVQIDIFLNKFVEGVPYLCRALDISEFGIAVGALLEPELAPAFDGEPVQVGLQFQLPGTEPVVYAEAEVVRIQSRTSSTGFGLRFTHVAERHRLLIRAYVERMGRALDAHTPKELLLRPA
jgi:c-di-GMP-binding flagellar brake protein YcgR